MPCAQGTAARRRKTSPRRRARPHRPAGTRAQTVPPTARPNDACWIRCDCRARRLPWFMSASEFHLRHLLDRLAFVAEIEELLRREAERSRKQRRRELLDAGVVFAHRVV